MGREAGVCACRSVWMCVHGHVCPCIAAGGFLLPPAEGIISLFLLLLQGPRAPEKLFLCVY